VRETLSTLAASRGEPLDDVAEAIFANACSLFQVS
jgi:Tat protein secretion system quality control protein TatD with DNase activity